MNRLTLIITSHGRPDALKRLLESLAHQTLPHGHWDALVMDDASPAPDLARIEKLVEATPFKAELIALDHGGPARARNIGVQRASGDVVLFLNNDVILSPGHLKAHWDYHAAHPDTTHLAHGETQWHPESLRGAHMQVLRDRLFRYDLPHSTWEESFLYFITSSLSGKRSLFADHPFDEQFRQASMEDTELGYRLFKKLGTRVALLRGEPALHWHYHSRRAFIRRAQMTGYNAARVLRKFPEFEKRLIGVYKTPTPKTRLLRASMRLLMGDAKTFWEEVDTAYYVKGFWRAVKEGV